MSVKNKKITLLVIVVLATFDSFSQDVPLSQFYHSLFFLNPAYAGAASGNRISSFYRNQWPRSESNFKTYGVAYDQAIKKQNSGFGVAVLSDNVGAFTNISIDLAYSYKVKLWDKLKINMGLQGGLIQKYRNSDELQFENPESVAGGLSKISPDFAVGAVGFFKDFYAGVSVHHINKPRLANDGGASRLNIKYSGQLGYVIYFPTGLVNQKRVLMPSILVQQQGLQQNITWGSVFQYDLILGGLLVRHNILSNFDVLIFSAGFKTSNMRIAYSYDMNIGKKTLIPLGAHEISLTLLYNNEKKKKYKALGCPSFLE